MIYVIFHNNNKSKIVKFFIFYNKFFFFCFYTSLTQIIILKPALCTNHFSTINIFNTFFINDIIDDQFHSKVGSTHQRATQLGIYS